MPLRYTCFIHHVLVHFQKRPGSAVQASGRRLKALNFGLSYLGKSLDFIGLEPREFAASNPLL